MLWRHHRAQHQQRLSFLNSEDGAATGAREGALRRERRQSGEEGWCLCPPAPGLLPVPTLVPRGTTAASWQPWQDRPSSWHGSHHLLWCFLGLCASFQKEKPQEKKEKVGASWLGVRGQRRGQRAQGAELGAEPAPTPGPVS